MVSAGILTIYVSDMNRAVEFYTNTLGLQLVHRFGDHWAQVATEGLNIGLHPGTPESPPGRPGSLSIGFYVSEPIEKAVARLKSQGVEFGAINDDKALKIAHFSDPDGNPLYMCEMKKEYKHTEPAAS